MHHTFFRRDLKNRGPVTSVVGPTRWRYLEQPNLELQPEEADRAKCVGVRVGFDFGGVVFLIVFWQLRMFAGGFSRHLFWVVWVRQT